MPKVTDLDELESREASSSSKGHPSPGRGQPSRSQHHPPPDLKSAPKSSPPPSRSEEIVCNGNGDKTKSHDKNNNNKKHSKTYEDITQKAATSKQQQRASLSGDVNKTAKISLEQDENDTRIFPTESKQSSTLTVNGTDNDPENHVQTISRTQGTHGNVLVNGLGIDDNTNEDADVRPKTSKKLRAAIKIIEDIKALAKHADDSPGLQIRAYTELFEEAAFDNCNLTPYIEGCILSAQESYPTHPLTSLMTLLAGVEASDNDEVVVAKLWREIKACAIGIVNWLMSIPFNKKIIAKMISIYKGQKKNKSSYQLARYMMAYDILIPFANAFRKKGIPGYDGKVLSQLHYGRATRLLDIPRFQLEAIDVIIEQDLEQAVVLSNYQELAILNRAIDFKLDLGKTRQALGYVDDALKLSPNNLDLQLTKEWILINLDDMSDVTSVAGSEYPESDHEIDMDYLEGTNVGNHLLNVFKTEGNVIILMARKNETFLRILDGKSVPDCQGDKKEITDLCKWEVEKADKSGKMIRLHIGDSYLAIQRKKKQANVVVEKCESKAKSADTIFQVLSVANCVRFQSCSQPKVYLSCDSEGTITACRNKDNDTQLFEVKELKPKGSKKPVKPKSTNGVKKKHRVEYKPSRPNSVQRQINNVPVNDSSSVIPAQNRTRQSNQQQSRPVQERGRNIRDDVPGRVSDRYKNKKPESAHAKHGSMKQPKAKTIRPSAKSSRIYSNLREEYEIRVACKHCMEKEADEKWKEKSTTHVCEKNQFFVRLQGSYDNWDLIREKPRYYKRRDDICESIEPGQLCREGTRCVYPHSRNELYVWNLLAERRWSLESLIKDLTKSTLLIQHKLMDATPLGKIRQVCRTCFKEGNFNDMKKQNKNTPRCGANHPWEKGDNIMIVFKLNGDEERYIAIQDPGEDENIEESVKTIISGIHSLTHQGFTTNDILLESRRVTSILAKIEEAKRNISARTKAPRFRHASNSQRDSVGSDQGTIFRFGEPGFCDEFNEGMVASEDIDIPYDPEKEVQAFDGVLDDSFEDVDSDDDYEEEDYLSFYTLRSVAISKAKVQNSPEKYKECKISLKGSQDATCTPLDGSPSINIRGRHNCGPTFDGDIVIVKELKVGKLDSGESGESGVCLRFGRVACVVHESCDRKNYRFVCSVDPYLSHLMRPLCGRAPKVHVEHRLLSDLPDHLKNNRVCVYENNDGHLDHIRTVELDQSQKKGQLFVVQFYRWDHSKMYPYGYVTHVIPPGLDLESGQRIINLMCQVPPSVKNINTETYTEVPAIAPGVKILDLTKENVFSIDPEGCRDVDDALSVRQVPPGPEGERLDVYEVGIHIADVTSHVKKDDPVDIQAFKSKISYYPVHGSNIHMLPESLGTNLCSLLENKIRHCLSVFVKLDTNGHVVGSVRITRTKIRNRKQMTYAEAQKIIEDDTGNLDDNEKDVQLLHELAKSLRKNRLQESRYVADSPNVTENDITSAEAHQLIEEFMILANKCVANVCRKHFPDHTILRVQSPPDEGDLKKFIEIYKPLIQSSPTLLRLFETSYALRKFKIKRPKSSDDSTSSTLISVKSAEGIKAAINREDVDGLKKILCQEKHHPSLALVLGAWLDIQKPARVVLVENGKHASHFSLMMENYTWFTSPIRRSVDMIVHRFIKAYLDGAAKRPEAPYTKDELRKFCESFNLTHARQKKHDKMGRLLKAAVALRETPVYMPCFISAFDNDEGMELIFPYLPHLPKSITTLSFRSLNVNGKPLVNSNTGDITATWQKRLYNTSKPELCRTRQMCKPAFFFQLNNHKDRVVEIPAVEWDKISRSLWDGKDTQLLNLMQKTDLAPNRTPGHDDATSEVKHGELLIRHHTQFKTSYNTGQILQVQVGASLGSGIIEPNMKALSVTKSIDMCMEHNFDPIHCFAEIATLSHRRHYESLTQYQETWLPMLNMESACVSVQDGDPITIHNVRVHLEKRNGVYQGYFELSKGFCDKRHIHLIKNTKDEEEQEDSMDYICLKFHTESSSKTLLGNSVVGKSAKSLIASHLPWKNIWVAHAVGKRASLTKEKMIKLEFAVNYTNSEPQESIKRAMQAGDKLMCNLEYMTKALPHRRMIEAVEKVDSSDVVEFCKQIVRGHRFTPEELDLPEEQEKLPKDLDIHGVSIPPNNYKQEKAIKSALTKKFTILQGPPGTGKTLTCVKIAYWFHQMNKQKPDGPRPQVMYCGPSNSSVDVATKLMTRVLGKKCPKILRIYGDSLETQVFPVPRDVAHSKPGSRGRQYKLVGKKEEMDYGLHYLIRKESNTHYSRILKFDKMFKANKEKPENISDEEIEKYLKLITDAAIEEIPKYDIIFCTCSVSPSPRIKRAANVYQLIIDECGMCMEPESLVPLINFQPIQIVLVGDHKQLRPIVKDDIAKQLGLEVSLFERHANIMVEDTVMLDEQYRMHPAICKFPSTEFYEGKLQTNPSIEWTLASRRMNIWPNIRHPIVFCHVKGEEKNLAVATEEGNENSKSNEAERDHVVRIFLNLVNNNRVSPEDITVLSQYKAQCSIIKCQLEGFGFEGAKVMTVVASQGDEQDYIILSTVRSLPRYEISKQPSDGWLKRNLGFITDENQINVALTRAKKGLIIVGNKHLLKSHKMWRRLLWYYELNVSVVKAKTFPYNDRSPWHPSDPKRNQRGLEQYLEEQRILKEREKKFNSTKNSYRR